MKIKRELIDSWTYKAEKDLLSAKHELSFYAVVVRHPDEWFVPDLEEAKETFEIANNIKEFVLNKI